MAKLSLKVLLAGLILSAPASAQAAKFICTGSSKFSDIVDFETIELKWPNKKQMTFGDVKTTKVFFDLDMDEKSKSQYLQITVMKMNESGIINSQSAKGSIRGMVMYSQLDGIDTSQVVCLPTKD